MKHLSSLLLVMGIICWAGFSFAQSPLPDVNAKTLDGQTVNLLDTYGKSGKITVISFWATWCKPCQSELDAMSYLYPEWKENYEVEIVAISIDDQRALAKVGPLVETKGWEYTILLGSESEMRNSFNFSSIPQTFLIGKDGAIAYVHNGYAPGDEEELAEKVEMLAGEQN